MVSFDELLAELLEEPPEVLGYLSDLVHRGRMQSDDIPSETAEVLAKFELVAFLVQRNPRGPVRTWVYPSPLGLKVFGILEREADRQEEERVKPTVRTRGKRRDPSGVTR